MILIVWVVLGVAALIFVIFAGWPLYSTYRTRRQGADVREGDEYLKEKREWQHAEAEHQDAPPPAPPGGGGPSGVGRGDTPLRSGTDPADEPGTKPDPGH
jgi:hypothetical protein